MEVFLENTEFADVDEFTEGVASALEEDSFTEAVEEELEIEVRVEAVAAEVVVEDDKNDDDEGLVPGMDRASGTIIVIAASALAFLGLVAGICIMKNRKSESEVFQGTIPDTPAFEMTDQASTRQGDDGRFMRSVPIAPIAPTAPVNAMPTKGVILQRRDASGERRASASKQAITL